MFERAGCTCRDTWGTSRHGAARSQRPVRNPPARTGEVRDRGGVLDDEARYRVVCSRDPRFEGRFVTAVTSTGIYCRPSCPATTPRRENVRFYPTAAAASAAGFRACRRCRLEAAPGSPEWDARGDLVGRAVRLIRDGVVDRDGVSGLAAQLGYSARHLHRQLQDELGVGPLALARAQRAQTARTLLETTPLPTAEVAFAAGFGSVRQFNETMRAVFGLAPDALRTQRPGTVGAGGDGAGGSIELRLPVRRPFHGRALLRFLAMRAVAGVEQVHEGTYRRTLRLPHGHGVAELTPYDDCVRARLRLQDLRDLTAAVARCRQLFDLDADPAAVDATLAHEPALCPSLARRPGLRVPGSVDGGETAVRAVLGQQVSVAAARGSASRIALEHGQPLGLPDATLTHVFPDPEALGDLDPQRLALPRARARAVVTLCAALGRGDLTLDPSGDRDGVPAALLALPGVGQWTASYVALRVLHDPDVFLPTDLAARRGARRRSGSRTTPVPSISGPSAGVPGARTH